MMKGGHMNSIELGGIYTRHKINDVGRVTSTQPISRLSGEKI